MRLAPFVLVVPAVLACARQQQRQRPNALAQLSPERATHCRAVADSVFQNVARERLPDARPGKAPPPRLLMRVPLSVPPGVKVKTNFVVRPDGTGDASTLVITGTNDTKFRRDALNLVANWTLTPAEIDGCPVWSQTTIVSVRSAVQREGMAGRPN